MSFSRKFNRASIRRKHGSDAVKNLWERIQVAKYGLLQLKQIRKVCSPGTWPKA